MSEKLVIAIPTSGRLAYFERCLESLSRAVPPTQTVLVRPDIPDTTEIEKILRRYFPEAVLVPFQKRLFADAAIIETRNFAFSNLDADLVLSMDDDLVVAPEFVRVLLELRAWAGDYLLQSSIDFSATPQAKMQLADAVLPGLTTGTHILMSRTAWQVTQKTLDEYMARWAGRPSSEMDAKGIRAWFREVIQETKPMLGDARELFLTRDYGIACDAALQVACMVGQVRTACLCVNRAITIGESGANFTPESFAHLRHVRLDIEGVDAQPHWFHWYAKTHFVVLSHNEPEIFNLLNQLIGQNVFVVDDWSYAEHYERIKAHPCHPTVVRRALAQNFAEQRNYVNHLIPSGDWIIAIDADETFCTVEEMLREIALVPTMAASRLRINQTIHSDQTKTVTREWHVRVWRNCPERISWVYRLHEQLTGFDDVTRLEHGTVLHVKTGARCIQQHAFYSKRFKNKQVDIAKAEVIEGFSASTELEWLAHEAAKRRLIVEVGALNGRTTRALADNALGMVYTVDHFMGSPGEPNLTTDTAEAERRFAQFLLNVADLMMAGKVVPLRMSSANASDFFRWSGLKPDLIFIDGSHTVEAVMSDIEQWREVLAPGGMLCGHDENWPAIRDALTLTKTNYETAPETTIWVKK